jgi:hypothetical protein
MKPYKIFDFKKFKNISGELLPITFDELYYYFKINKHHQIFNQLKKKIPNYWIKFLLNILILRFDRSIRYIALILAFFKFKRFMKNYSN